MAAVTSALPSPTTAALAHMARVTGLVLLASGLFFGTVGFWPLSMAVRLYSRQADLRAHAEHATGTIVDFKQAKVDRRTGSRSVVRFSPIFTFTDYRGETRRVTSRIGRDLKPEYQIGQTLPIIYHHDRPDEAEVDTFYASWGGLLTVTGLGVAFFSVGALHLSLGTRRLLWPHRFVKTRTTGRGGAPPARDPAIPAGP